MCHPLAPSDNTALVRKGQIDWPSVVIWPSYTVHIVAGQKAERQAFYCLYCQVRRQFAGLPKHGVTAGISI